MKLKEVLLRSLKWIGVIAVLPVAGCVEAEIYNYVQEAGLGSDSYQSGWQFVQVVYLMIPVLIASSVVALFGNMKRIKWTPLRLFLISSQAFMGFYWFMTILQVTIF